MKINTVCEDLPASDIPSFTEPECKPNDRYRPDTQGRFLWIKGTVNIPASMMESAYPLGLNISGKASMAAYIGGKEIGRNGTPHDRADREIPGLIDTIIPLNRALLHEGENEIVIAMSGHKGFLSLPNPIAVLAVGPFRDPTDYVLHRYLPALPLLGLLIAGSLYFGLLAYRHGDDRTNLLPPLIALFASMQMLTEISRGFVAYSYQFHDIRLALIILFATLGGTCLLAHVAARFARPQMRTIVFAGTLATLAVIYVTQSYDSKAAFALMTPAIMGAIISLVGIRKGLPRSKAYAATLTVGAFAIFKTTSDFLDVYFYYVVAALLLFLFFQQLQDMAAIKAQQAADQARTDRLELALAEARQKQVPSAVAVKTSGEVEMVQTEELVYCQGARDYVELVVTDGSRKLHGGSLTELEKSLPITFLRVHRSYIVNTRFVEKLERDASGSGTLSLSGGETIPVSRRIMPTVRKALS
ncbi:MAG: LytTR family transcriptional regulator [Alphaproteobacteria bacterium]|nr:LytTR family transcriptional regulator [Alphaproteobacteria bacterium]